MHQHLLPIPLALLLLLGGAQAAEPAAHTGPYLGGGLGLSGFRIDAQAIPATHSDRSGTGFKLYGGWRFTEHLGVEAGYAHLGRFSQEAGGSGAATVRKGTARAFYGAVTGRLPLGERFALHGRVGLAAGRVSGSGAWPAATSPEGRKNGVMFGVGAEYGLAPGMALTVDMDYFGKLSPHAKGALVTVGLRAAF